MAAMGPGCVKTRTLFFKVEFWPRLGGNSSQEIFRHHLEGTTTEKILSRSHEGAVSLSLGHKQTKSTCHAGINQLHRTHPPSPIYTRPPHAIVIQPATPS